MSRKSVLSLSLATALLLALAPPAAAQRASLADRVAALELRAANSQANLDLLNQITALRTDVQSLRSQLEELQQANEAMRASGKSQYLDIDSRLERLESSRAASPADPTGKPAAVPPPVPRASTSPRKSAPAAVASTSPTPGSATPTGAELQAYNLAFDALKAGRYAESSTLFADFLDRFPGGVYAPNALYWLGESYYATRNYPLALEQFEQLLDRFPTHDKAPGALLKVGLTRLSLGQGDAARAAFADVVSRYPDTDAARSASERLGAMAR